MSVKHQIARNNITDACKAILELDYDVGTGSNVSVRISEEELIAITPTGVSFNKLTPEMISIIDMEGNLIDGEYEPSKAFMMHLSIYKSRQDTNAIIHTHPTYCTALALARKPIPPAWEDMVEIVGGQVNVSPYALPSSNMINEGICDSLGDRAAVLVSNNGLLCVGETLPKAIVIAEICEKSAHSVLLAHMVGGPVPLPEEHCDELKMFYLNKQCRL